MSKTWAIVKTTMEFADMLQLAYSIGGVVVIASAYSWVSHNMPLGSQILLAIGLAFFIVPLFCWVLIRLIRKIKYKIKMPQSLIFPYIQTVNASALMNGENSLYVLYCYPNALPYEWKITSLRGYIVCDSTPTTEHSLRPMTIFKQRFGEVGLTMPLEQTLADKIRQKVRTCKPIKIQLKIACWDENNKEHDLSTKELTILPIDKLE